MRTSKTVIFHQSGQALEIVRVPVPALRPGEMLVRVEYTTLCRSDLYTFSGTRKERTPTILGHEIVGYIEEVAAGAPETDACGAPLRLGDRVTWAIYASDPQDSMSLKGMPQKAAALFKYGHEPITETEHLHGGLAEYCILRKHTPVVRISEALPRGVAATLNCACATSAGALRLAGALHGRRVLVIGAGMLGLYAAAMADSAGARVFIQDIAPSRLTRAAEFGAEPDQAGSEMDIVLDFSGSPEAMESGVNRLSVGGIMVLVGAVIPMRPISIDPERMVRRLLTVCGLHNYREDDLVAAVRFMESNVERYPFASLVGHGGCLEEADRIFEIALMGSQPRVGIAPA